MTLPLIFALRTGDPDLRAVVERYFAEEDAAEDDDARVAAIIAGITRAGGLTQTIDAVASYAEQAKASLVPLENNPMRSNLEELADALVRGGKGFTT
jgi:geranylgeranyl pyrophosphate synthase